MISRILKSASAQISSMATEEDKLASFDAIVSEMTNGFSSGRQLIQSLRQDESALDTKDGISFLSLKHHLLLSYLNSLSLSIARRAVGHSLSSRVPPAQTISVLDRNGRGNGAGDLVDAMIEHRAIFEKMKTLETRMRYQINKLLRLAQETDKGRNIADDPLAFRPNPQNLVAESSDQAVSEAEDETKSAEDKIYRPPRVAPVPYIEQTKSSRKNRAPVPSALAALSQDHTRPFAESTSGLGATPGAASGRADYVKKLQEYEEENFSRLVMKKADAKRRLRDEADLALGGGLTAPGNRGRRHAGSLEDTFGDVLRSIERKGGRTENGLIVDGYEELRKRGRKSSALERSRTDKRNISPSEIDGSSDRRRKRTRFEVDTKRRARKKR